jgi:hypothetical protein
MSAQESASLDRPGRFDTQIRKGNYRERCISRAVEEMESTDEAKIAGDLCREAKSSK